MTESRIGDASATPRLAAFREEIRSVYPQEAPPSVIAANMADLQWDVSEEDLTKLQADWPNCVQVLQTSAKTGQNVHEAFEQLSLAVQEREHRLRRAQREAALQLSSNQESTQNCARCRLAQCFASCTVFVFASLVRVLHVICSDAFVVVAMSAPQAHSAPAAELQRQMATAAAQQGARAAADRARTGFFEVQAYISENPTSLKILCFCSGLALIAFSLLGLFNPFDINIIPKESWLRACGDLQGTLFRKAYFLASQTGRSLFYLYVGTMTLLLLPGGILDFFNRIIGIALCVLAMLMLARDWCAPLCCKDSYNQMGSGSQV
eukprot:s4767_g11.t2